MRHNNQGRKLGRTTAHRKAMLSNMVASLLEHERITTTLPKAKEARRLAERVITLGKDGTLAARRRAFSIVRSHALVKKLFDDVAPLFKERNGGYTRILRLGNRHGDNAEMGVLELVARTEKPAAEAAAPTAGEAAPAAPATPAS